MPKESQTNQTLHRMTMLITGRYSPDRIADDEWPAMTDLALGHGLGPMLYWAIKSQNAVAAVPSQCLSALTASAHRSAMFDILYEESICTITKAFQEKGIPLIWLKGAVLARTVYPQSSLRPMSDLDVLVPQARIEESLILFGKLDYGFGVRIGVRSFFWRPKSNHIPKLYLDGVLRHEHHFSLRGGSANIVPLELHFGLIAHNANYHLLPEKQMAWFWENTRPFSLKRKISGIGLSPEAHLIYMAAHSIYQHGEAKACLRWDLDLHLLVADQQPDWDIIIDQAVVLGWTGAVFRALERAVEFFQTPVPEKVLEQLLLRRPSHEGSFQALKKEPVGNRWVRVRKKLSQLSTREKIAYFFQSTFPNSDYIRSRYGVSSDRRIWPYYIYRWFDQGREILRAKEMHETIDKGDRS